MDGWTAAGESSLEAHGARRRAEVQRHAEKVDGEDEGVDGERRKKRERQTRRISNNGLKERERDSNGNKTLNIEH